MVIKVLIAKFKGSLTWDFWLPVFFMNHFPRREIIVRGQSYFSRLPKYWPPIPLSARQVCTPPPLLRGEDRLAGRRGGWGVNILEDERNRIALLQWSLYDFPPGSWACQGVHSEFFWKFSEIFEIKDNHHCQHNGHKRKKNYIGNLFIFCWDAVRLLLTPYTYKMSFYLMVTLRCRQADFVAIVSSQVSLIPTQNFGRCCCFWG